MAPQWLLLLPLVLQELHLALQQMLFRLVAHQLLSVLLPLLLMLLIWALRWRQFQLLPQLLDYHDPAAVHPAETPQPWPGCGGLPQQQAL
jgi:hypothetical protein